MHLRLLLISHAATAAMRSGRFPSDDAPDERVAEATQAWRPRIEAMQAAAAFRAPPCGGGLPACLTSTPPSRPHWQKIDFGRWTGQGLADLAAAEPDSRQRGSAICRRRRMAANPLGALAARACGAAGCTVRDTSGTVIALTHASVIRAAILHALGAPLSAHACIEWPPPSLVERWRSARGRADHESAG
jgi:hypothetical protein